MNYIFVEALKEALCGRIDLSEEFLRQCSDYYEYLLEVNSYMNLTRITEPQEAAVKHFADSLCALIFAPECFPRGASVADIGSGAGFPGLPIKLARPDLDVHLIDSRKKRAGFLSGLADRLGTDVTVVPLRAEDAARDAERQGSYDVTLARAVSDVRTLCGYCHPLLKPGGYALLYKGEKARAELEEASNYALKTGYYFPHLLETPINGMNHAIIVLQKAR